MKSIATPQRGMTLIIGLIMLTIITMVVVTNFKMAQTNLLAVGNMQFRDEAIAATNFAIEQMVGEKFTAAPADTTINVDFNNDTITDYQVNITVPTCFMVARIDINATGSKSSVMSGLPPIYVYNTVWELIATVTDAVTGAHIVIHNGIRVTLTQTKYDEVCVI